MTDVPAASFKDATIYRVIPSRHPVVDLFREVASPEDWELLHRVAQLTDDRIQEEEFSTGLIRLEDRTDASKSHYIVGPLSRPDPRGSHFSDGSFGVLYAGLDFETAQAEVVARRESFLRATSQRPQRIDVRVILISLTGTLHDLRGEDPDKMSDQNFTRDLALRLRGAGSYGIVFNSNARPGGECVAVFRPPVLSNCRQERHFGYNWDGNNISSIIEYSQPTSRIAVVS
jgi:hypothetical protein